MGGHSHKRTLTPILRLFFEISTFLFIINFSFLDNVHYSVLYNSVYNSVRLTNFFFRNFFRILFPYFFKKLRKQGIHGKKINAKSIR